MSVLKRPVSNREATHTFSQFPSLYLHTNNLTPYIILVGNAHVYTTQHPVHTTYKDMLHVCVRAYVQSPSVNNSGDIITSHKDQ